MSMINEKREEILNKINALEEDRKIRIAARKDAYLMEIDKKVEVYKASLMANFEVYCNKVEAEEPISEEFEKLQSVLKAIDEVISYENSCIAVEEIPAVEEVEIAPVEEVLPEVQEEVEAPVEVNEIPETKEVLDSIEVVVDEEKIEIHTTEMQNVGEPRPGMAYVGIPERR